MTKQHQHAAKDATSDQQPLVSVVTVTYNAAATVRRTLDSTLSQTLLSVELVVVDGGSTDGTVDIINSYGKRISRWVSEPDRGIYDAMNKGAKLATGRFVQFLNAGDVHYSPDSLAVLAGAATDEVDIVYADMMFDYEGRYRRLKRARPTSWLWATTACLHPSSLARRSVLLDRPFDLRYPLAADHDFFVRCWMEGLTFRQLELPVTVFDRGGVSNARWFEALDEAHRIALERCPRPYLDAYYRMLIAYYRATAQLRDRLPPSVVRWVRTAGSLREAMGRAGRRGAR